MKTNKQFLYIIDSMAAYDPATDATSVSPVMVLTWLYPNNRGADSVSR